MREIYQQGQLDGLCGMYAIVNSINHLLIIRPPYDGFDADLFAAVARSIPRKDYPEVLLEGMALDELVKVANATRRYMKKEFDVGIRIDRPFRDMTFRSRTEFFEALDPFQGGWISTFILWIDWPGRHGGSHWTVLREITSSDVRLIDSAGQTKVPIAKVALTGTRKTRFDPSSTVRLTLAEIGGKTMRLPE